MIKAHDNSLFTTSAHQPYKVAGVRPLITTSQLDDATNIPYCMRSGLSPPTATMTLPPRHFRAPLPPGVAADRLTDHDLLGHTVCECRHAARQFGLTHRQRDVFFLGIAGLAPKEIAWELGLATSYVRATIRDICDAMQTRDGWRGIQRAFCRLLRESPPLGEEP